jgi:hypothetical protein
MECLQKSDPFKNSWGVTIGFAGAAPIATTDGNIVCGFGEQLVCFNQQGKVIWQFRYPQLDARDPNGGIKLYKCGDSEQLIYESCSEVTISSNIYERGLYLFFVLSEGTRHISYVVKMAKNSGNVIWTVRIDGYPGSYAIHDISESGLLVQNESNFWLVSEDGSQRGEFVLDIDGTTCSNAVRVSENQYAVNSDLGIHVFKIDLPSILRFQN